MAEGHPSPESGSPRSLPADIRSQAAEALSLDLELRQLNREGEPALHVPVVGVAYHPVQNARNKSIT
jgi:hypothetical protein